MNLILFLGSGVSIESGHPNVVDLTRQILSAATYPDETRFLNALNEYDKRARGLGTTTYTTSAKGVGENYRDYTSYEDLYHLCDEISLFDWGLHDNAMVPAFIESLAVELCTLLTGKSQIAKFQEIGRFAQAAKKYINQAVIARLASPNHIKGLDLVLALAEYPEITSLNIVTLNHDLLVEDLLSRNEVPFVDGFGELDGDVKWFESDQYLAAAKIKIVKLHGSIDWYKMSVRGQLERDGKIVQKAEQLRDGKSVAIEIVKKLPNVLTGLNKVKYYNSGMYTDIHYHFQKMLYENTLMVMSGYGWGDDAINNRLMTWIDKRKENKLILLHTNPDWLMHRSMVFDRDRSNWEKAGKLKIIFKWLKDANVQELLEAAE